jgi:amidase
VLTRSVRDSALALDVLAGSCQGDPFAIAPPERTFVGAMKDDPGHLKIAFSTKSPIGSDVAPEAIEAVQSAAKLLSSLGHNVVEDQPHYDGATLARCYLDMYFGQVAATLGEVRAAGAKSPDFELTTLLLEALGKAMSAGDYIRSHRRWNEFSRALGQFHQRYDFFMTPAVATPPVTHEATVMPAGQRRVLSFLLNTGLLGIMARLGLMEGAIAKLSRQNLTYVPFTQLANLTGTPAMSVPLHWTEDGLPLGVQFIAKFGGEAQLLQLASQLEQAQPWMHRLPSLAHSK